MRLYLIRHAQSENNVAYSAEGGIVGHKPDPEITDSGHHQSQRLARYMADSGNESRKHPHLADNTHDFELTHIYCSLMTRSLLTAEYISRETGITATAREDLFERKGIYSHDERGNEIGKPGPGRQYFHDRFPGVALPEDLPEDGWWNRPVESDEDFLSRVTTSLEEITARHLGKDDVVALVVHGDYIDQAVNELMGVDRHTHNYADLWLANWVFHNTSISRVDFRENTRNVIYLNRVDHLTPELTTW